MIAFADTSFLCSVYREQIHSSAADRYLQARLLPLTVSSLLLLEFRQSVRLQTRLFSLDRQKGFSAKESFLMLNDLRQDLDRGVIRSEPVDWSMVHRLAEALSEKHTASGGHRLIDILHVATGLHLGAREFLTFDANQRALAEAEGMTVPL
ncbi:MAG: PIN domain-containing protein [Verrucomicrobiaceae bacterium]|nr:MAG: PIN domain-containing protein [Verrucomicrobiaceae bacterium]